VIEVSPLLGIVFLERVQLETSSAEGEVGQKTGVQM